MSTENWASTTQRYLRPGLAAGLLLAFSLPVPAGRGFSEWGTAQATVGGGCPIESRDGNQLYTASGRAGTLDIWTYRRDGRNGEFTDRTRLEAPVSLDDADDFCRRRWARHVLPCPGT